MAEMKFTYWKTKFERINFGFRPHLKQTADVLFKVRHSEFSPYNVRDFEDAAWAAVWKQNPHWKNPNGPAGKNCAGWSSVLGGYVSSKYIKVKIITE